MHRLVMRLMMVVCTCIAIRASAEEELKFPKDFKWGVATCEYQNSGSEKCPDSNWAHWEKQEGAIQTGEIAGESTCHYDNPLRTIKQIKALGCNTYRFSVEWSLIEPRQGEYAEEVIEHYSDVVDALLANGIEPMITLHHFSHPQWFEELGAFEKTENNRHLVLFAKKIFNRLSDRVKLWVTINEPGVYAAQGYYMGDFPPGTKVLSRKLLKPTATVVKNLMMAHASMYGTMKREPNGRECQIGLVHQFLRFNSANILTQPMTTHLTYVYHKGIFEFLKTGEFKFGYRFGLGKEEMKIKKAKDMMDFIGINYYTTPLVKAEMKMSFDNTTCDEEAGEYMTDMPFRAYPKGLGEVIRECQKELGIPIYITENGAPDREDKFRKQWIHDHLKEVSDAIADGCDVRGFYYWTLNDNWEWDRGYSQKFGLYEYDFETHTPTLREGSKEYIRIIRESRG